MTIDITQQLNYSAAVRKAHPEYDDDTVRAAAELLVMYMDVKLEPDEVKKTLEFLRKFNKLGKFLN